VIDRLRSPLAGAERSADDSQRVADDSQRSADDSRTPGNGRKRAASDRRWHAATGLLAGAFATVVMTVFRAPVARSPPPPAWFWAKFVAGGDPEDHAAPALVLHLVYGSVAGAAFGLLAGPRTGAGEARRERRATAFGAVYGLCLSGFGAAVVLGRLLDMDLDPDERFVFHVGHLVYGLALGTRFGSRVAE
jgi:hypothetical protein